MTQATLSLPQLQTGATGWGAEKPVYTLQRRPSSGSEQMKCKHTPCWFSQWGFKREQRRKNSLSNWSSVCIYIASLLVSCWLWLLSRSFLIFPSAPWWWFAFFEMSGTRLLPPLALKRWHFVIIYLFAAAEGFISGYILIDKFAVNCTPVKFFTPAVDLRLQLPFISWYVNTNEPWLQPITFVLSL